MTTTPRLSRRQLVAGACAAAAAPLLGTSVHAQARSFAPQVGAWRTFEVTTTVNVASVKGATSSAS